MLNLPLIRSVAGIFLSTGKLVPTNLVDCMKMGCEFNLRVGYNPALTKGEKNAQFSLLICVIFCKWEKVEPRA